MAIEQCNLHVESNNFCDRYYFQVKKIRVKFQHRASLRHLDQCADGESNGPVEWDINKVTIQLMLESILFFFYLFLFYVDKSRILEIT